MEPTSWNRPVRWRVPFRQVMLVLAVLWLASLPVIAGVAVLRLVLAEASADRR